jgi:pimeloyl-ACP methyl ester carboxylesterase
MKIRIIYLLLLTALAGVDAARSQHIEYTDCFLNNCTPFITDEGINFMKLTVPENYELEEGKKLTLFVVRLKAHDRDSKNLPVLFLTGGPGAATLTGGIIAMMSKHPYRQAHDLILIDFRGMGLSEPEFCTGFQSRLAEIVMKNLTAEQARSLTAEAYRECFISLQERDLDLNAYNSASLVKDLEQLRKALGYEQWNLWGISYGTRVAQTYMRDFPQAVRAAILDSPVPMGYRFWGREQLSYKESLDLLFEACLNNPGCNGSFPDLEARFYRAMESLKENPLKIQTSLAEEGVAWLNFQDIHIAVHQMIYYPGFYPIFPWLVKSIEDRSIPFFTNLFPELMFILNSTNSPLQRIIVQADNGSYVSDFVSQPGDPLHNALNFLDNDLIVQLELDFIRENPLEFLPVISEIPSLILVGEFDPITRPYHAEILHSRLPNSFLLNFPAQGHGLTATNPCARDLSNDFLINPFQRPVENCISAMYNTPVSWANSLWFNPRVAVMGSRIMSDKDWLPLSAIALPGFALFLWTLLGVVRLIKRKRLSDKKLIIHSWVLRVTSVFALLLFAGLAWMLVRTGAVNNVMPLVGLLPEVRLLLFLSFLVIAGCLTSLYMYGRYFRKLPVMLAIVNGFALLGLLLASVIIVEYRLFPW